MTNTERKNAAIEKASLLFWETIAGEFPECKTGDFPPDAHFRIEAAMEQAVETWLDYNKPVPQAAQVY